MPAVGTVRTTISVPNDLKKRMDKVKEPVNWSAVACRAFESMLGEIAARKEKKQMDDVIQRLRASKQESESENRKAGREAGVAWAKDDASFAELSKLKDAMSGRDWDSIFNLVDGQSAYSPSQLLFFSIYPGPDEADRDDAANFWQCAVGDEVNLEEPEYLRGFCAGAMEIFGEVEGQL